MHFSQFSHRSQKIQNSHPSHPSPPSLPLAIVGIGRALSVLPRRVGGVPFLPPKFANFHNHAVLGEPRSARDRTEPYHAHDDFEARVTKWRAVPKAAKLIVTPKGKRSAAKSQSKRRPQAGVRCQRHCDFSQFSRFSRFSQKIHLSPKLTCPEMGVLS